MKFNKYLIISLILIINLTFFCVSSLSDPAVMVSDYELRPAVLMPGDEAVLSLTITNEETTATTTTTETSVSGSTTTSTVETEVDGTVLKKVWIPTEHDSLNNPLYSKPSYLDIGLLSAGKSINLDLLIIAHENLSEDIYFPDLKINLEANSHQDVTYPLKIKVSNYSVDLI